MVYKFSSQSGIKQFYSTILDYTFWTISTSSFINFRNDKWCSTTSLANIARLSGGANISDIVSQFWTGCDWNIPLSLQHMPHFFNHTMVREEQIFLIGFQISLVISLLNRLGLFSWKQEFPVVGLNSFGLHLFRLPKLQYSGRFFMDDFLQINIFRIKVCIYVLCVRFVKSMRNLFSIYYLNVLMHCIFGVEFNRFFLPLISLIRMIFFLLLRVMVVLWLN